MPFPKHEPSKAARKAAKKPQPAIATESTVKEVVVTGPLDPMSSSIKHDINHVAGLGAVATHLDWIGDAVARLTNDDTTVGLSIGQNRYSGPVQITPTDEDGNSMMDRLVTAMERIADSVAKLAGLTRPRLESWLEQDEYEPRYKNIAADGGAPGPKGN